MDLIEGIKTQTDLYAGYTINIASYEKWTW